MPKPSEFERQIESIEGMVQALENSADPALSLKARELVQALMSLHGACLERMLEIVRQTGALGQNVIDSFAGDEKVRSLLLLYDLHPLSLEARLLQALEKTAPYLSSHGVRVALVRVDETRAVRVRVEGGDQGCLSTTRNFESVIEGAIYELAPDVTAIQFENLLQGHKPAPAFVPVSALQAQPSAAGAASSSATPGAK